MDAALGYAQTHSDVFLRDLFAFLRIPSISAQPSRDPETLRAAQFAADWLRRIGLTQVRLLPTSAHPIVYGEWLRAPDRPTVVIYGHYDVQPPDPLEKWTAPPFEPTIRDGNLFARGAADNKGQIGAFLCAVESWLQGAGRLPVNVKFFIEGDEESGSAGMDAVPKYVKELAADAILISDCHWIDRGHPTIYYGMKGLCYFDIAVRGANRDLHSGTFGNLMPNPLNQLARVLGAMCPSDAPVAIPGFYDAVVDPPEAERELLRRLPFDEAALAREYGVSKVGVGDPRYSNLERNLLRPTMDLCGLWGGYQGDGAKTVLPSEAFAKVSFRLVPDQDPRTIAACFERHFRAMCPEGLTIVKCKLLGAAEPFMTPHDDPVLRACLRALGHATGRPAVLARDPASIPIAANFRKFLKVPVVLFGMGYADDDIHSPDEHLAVEQFSQGIDTYIHVLGAVGDVRSEH
ncbi:MAG: dipeptidase [Deltaproteobacteria bacterium]|nr:dipeptidase [Deltaproteobacteria bacterium]